MINRTLSIFPNIRCVQSAFFGDEAIAKRGVLKLVYPLEHGIVTDWDAMAEVRSANS